MYSVFGLGNPLLDFITHADFSLIERLNTQPGTMNLIEFEEMRKVLDMVETYRNIPGGSCSNTIRGIAWLIAGKQIAPPVYCGAIGSDDIGRRYLDIVKKSGVHTRLASKKTLTGCSVIIVTPDHERTMFTYLGACRDFREEDLDFETLKVSKFLHIAGYMWDTENQKKAVLKAIDFAETNGIKISFDLADPFVVQRYRKDFLSWMPGKVNILFGNREEIRIMIGEDLKDEDLINRTGRLSGLVIMKTGVDGCLVFENGQIHQVPGYKVQTSDTTAAGDCFASGFIFGMLEGVSTEAAARLANKLASQIVTVEGCDFSLLERQEVLAAGE